MSTKRALLTILAASAVLLALGIGSQLAGAQPPAQAPGSGVTVPYPGRLTDAAGQPVADGAYDLAFALYEAETGGEPVWSETQTGVMVQGGAFVATLGGGNPIPPAVLAGGERPGTDRRTLWLAVAVRGPGEAGFTALTPRQRLTAAAPTVPDSASAGLACPHDHWGEVWSGTGNGLVLYGSSNTYSTLYAEDTSPLGGYGVYGKSTSGYGVYGTSVYTGVTGISTSGYGVGVCGKGGWGVYGEGAYAVRGYSTGANGDGVSGIANNGANAYGVYGQSTSGYAGWFSGKVRVTGLLEKGGGGFKIDHPLDPANQYLYHSFVESPDMKNIYDGVVTLDANGEAVVQLPAWFGALNRDFRYQLTCIGGYAPVYIAEEIANNQFKIAGGKSGLKVSWQVTGIRQDPWANQNRLPVEEDKSPDDRGKYLHPESYGLPNTMGVEYAKRSQNE